MTKFLVTLPALALVVALSGSALADDGAVSGSALADMGLAGIEVMSDDAALAIRGKGYRGLDAPKPPKNADKPWSLAFGVSFASVDGDKAEAATLDGFIAEGKFMAMGEHGSEAGKTVTKVHELEVKGLPATKETHIKSLRVFAGGFATASSL